MRIIFALCLACAGCAESAPVDESRLPAKLLLENAFGANPAEIARHHRQLMNALATENVPRVGELISTDFKVYNHTPVVAAKAPGPSAPSRIRGMKVAPARGWEESYFQSLPHAYKAATPERPQIEVIMKGHDSASVIATSTGATPLITMWSREDTGDWKATAMLLNVSTETIERLRGTYARPDTVR